MSCYHSSLSILENILSHSDINLKDEWMVVDMVAGTDAFSGPLHAMFDVIYMVVEPTVESAAVFTQFASLAESAGVRDRVKIIANKIEDEDDIAYIEHTCRQLVVASVAYNKNLRRQRRSGQHLSMFDLPGEAMQRIEDDTRANAMDATHHLKKLHQLHGVFTRQQFTIDKYGDTLGHIDPKFTFEDRTHRD
jgi:CO dehydrogenase maturation factor